MRSHGLSRESSPYLEWDCEGTGLKLQRVPRALRFGLQLVVDQMLQTLKSCSVCWAPKEDLSTAHWQTWVWLQDKDTSQREVDRTDKVNRTKERNGEGRRWKQWGERLGGGVGGVGVGGRTYRQHPTRQGFAQHQQVRTHILVVTCQHSAHNRKHSLYSPHLIPTFYTI